MMKTREFYEKRNGQLVKVQWFYNESGRISVVTKIKNQIWYRRRYDEEKRGFKSSPVVRFQLQMKPNKKPITKIINEYEIHKIKKFSD